MAENLLNKCLYLIVSVDCCMSDSGRAFSHNIDIEMGSISSRYPTVARVSWLNHGFYGGARGVVVIVVGNGHGDTNSNPGRD